jgi:hypothetical protein
MVQQFIQEAWVEVILSVEICSMTKQGIAMVMAERGK